MKELIKDFLIFMDKHNIVAIEGHEWYGTCFYNDEDNIALYHMEDGWLHYQVDQKLYRGKYENGNVSIQVRVELDGKFSHTYEDIE